MIERRVPLLGMAALLVASLSIPACDGAPPEIPTASVSPFDNPSPEGARLPALASRGEDLLLVWLEPDDGPSLMAALRRGETWSAPAPVTRDEAVLVDPASPPAATILSDGTLAAAWVEKNPGGRYASDLRVAFSADGGATWSKPATPHHDGTATEHGFVSLLPDDKGGVDVLWLDGRAFATSSYGEGGTQLFHAAWDGAAFGAETAIDARVCDCCQTSLARAGARLVAAYRDRSDDELRDISLSGREEDGTWSSPRSVHEDGWRLKACPANGPAITALGQRTLLAWFTAAGAEPRVRAALSEDGARQFGPPIPLDAGDPIGRVDAVPIGPAGFAVSWLEKNRGRAEIRVRQIRADGALGSGAIVARTDAGRASGTPRLAAAEDGRAVVAWTDSDGAGGIRTARVSF